MSTKKVTRPAKGKAAPLPEYAVERAGWLAELFLQDLGPQAHVLRRQGNGGVDFDFLVTIPRDKALKHFAVDVQATEKPNLRKWSFASRHPQLGKWKNSNLPLLFLVVNPKTKELRYGWAKDAKRASGGLSLPLRPGEKLALDFADQK